MNRKRKPICGVSISRYYLDRERYSVAKLTVEKRESGDLVWHVIKGISHHGTFQHASDTARALAEAHGVDIYMECHRGDPVTNWMRAELNRRGLLAHL